MVEHVKKYNEAVKLFNENRIDEAVEILIELQKIKEVAPLCHYRLAGISNVTGDPEAAYNLYYSAFKALPNLTGALFADKHPNLNYVFKGMRPEKQRTDCPLCGGQGRPHWCYSLVEASGHNYDINPIRMWMYCEACHHIFARDFPEKIFLQNANPRRANPLYFSYYANILQSIRKYTAGMSLFEVGIGACECLLAAREMGYEPVFGIDVIERHVEDAKKLYGLDTETADFNEYKSDRKWDIIIMGDVLEHVDDPVQAIEKAASLLSDEGALWISTPNFDSAYSIVDGHNDSMRMQQYHLNYFSRESLYNLLGRFGLAPVEYQISGHYKGSMEVISVKEERLG